MAHLWGMDSEYAPSAQQFQQFADEGVAFYGGYIGGHAGNVWSKQDFANAAAAGMKIVAYWVGPLSNDPGYDQGVADGNACLAAMQERGLSGWVCEDAEGGIVRPQWSQGFVDALHAGSCSVQVYGATITLQNMGSIYDSWYLAWYTTPGQSTKTFLDQIIDFDIWQFGDGPNQDYDLCRDDCSTFASYNG